jgi:colicin import membrane protein
MRIRLAFLALCLGLVSPASAQDLQDEPRDLDFVGFQQFKEVSRVFVRTNDPARYHVSSGRDGVVTLTLENTGCATANHLRHLDTHFFDGPVVLIQPKLIEGPSNSIEVDIFLRRGVTVRQSQKDNVINLDFPRD